MKLTLSFTTADQLEGWFVMTGRRSGVNVTDLKTTFVSCAVPVPGGFTTVVRIFVVAINVMPLVVVFVSLMRMTRLPY